MLALHWFPYARGAGSPQELTEGLFVFYNPSASLALGTSLYTREAVGKLRVKSLEFRVMSCLTAMINVSRSETQNCKL